MFFLFVCFFVVFFFVLFCLCFVFCCFFFFFFFFFVFVLFYMSDCKYVIFSCVSDTFAGDFLSAQLIYQGKVELCHPLHDFRGKESKLFFADVADRKN